MKKIKGYLVFLLAAILVFTSCSSGNKMGGSKKGCGCGAHKGYVGY